MEGRRKSTDAMLMIAPRERRVQMDPIISTWEYTETPKVATKKLQPLVMMESIQERWAMPMASPPR